MDVVQLPSYEGPEYIIAVLGRGDGRVYTGEQVSQGRAPVAIVVRDGGAGQFSGFQEVDTVDGDDGAYRAGSFGAVPASSEAIAGLAVAAVGETRETVCGVCLGDFEAEDRLRKMPCNHDFHESCIFEWLRRSRLCPHCRFALDADEEYYIVLN